MSLLARWLVTRSPICKVHRVSQTISCVLTDKPNKNAAAHKASIATHICPRHGRSHNSQMPQHTKLALQLRAEPESRPRHGRSHNSQMPQHTKLALQLRAKPESRPRHCRSHNSQMPQHTKLALQLRAGHESRPRHGRSHNHYSTTTATSDS
jgi:hypothetical protein